MQLRAVTLPLALLMVVTAYHKHRADRLVAEINKPNGAESARGREPRSLP